MPIAFARQLTVNSSRSGLKKYDLAIAGSEHKCTKLMTGIEIINNWRIYTKPSIPQEFFRDKRFLLESKRVHEFSTNMSLIHNKTMQLLVIFVSFSCHKNCSVVKREIRNILSEVDNSRNVYLEQCYLN